MNSDIIQGNWKQLKGDIQSTWGKLTDDHLDQVEGNREKLSGIIQEQYGLAKDEVDKQIKEFERRLAA